MKWYHSIKFKNAFFFLLVASLFVVAMMLFFTNLKEQRLAERAESAVTLATNDVVKRLLLTQQRNEQIVEDMADVASLQMFDPMVITKLLHVSQENEIVSGGVWFEAYGSAPKAYFFHRDDKGDFVMIDEYVQKSGLAYEQMEFYVLAKELKEGETFWTKAYTDPVTKIRMITVVSPVYRDGQFVGVASVDIKLSLKQKQIFSKLVDSDERYFLLTDRIGEPLIYSQELAGLIKKPQKLKGQYTSVGFFFEHQSQQQQSVLAKKLMKASADFTAEEANLLAHELEHKNSSHAEKLLFQSNIIYNDPVFHEPSVVAAYYFPHTGFQMLIAIPEHIILKDTIAVYDKIMIITAVFAAIAAIFGFLLIRRSVVEPLQSIGEQIETTLDEGFIMLETKDKGEIGLLVDKLNERSRALQVSRENEMQNERLLLQQSKMAAMGEMLDAVAHQWKQPLNALSMYAELIKMNYEDGEVDAAYIEQFQKDIETQINHMTDTLGTFRSFFRPSTELHNFELGKVVEDVLMLAKDELTKNTINVAIDLEVPLTLYGSENEFKHLLLNVINNAKDAFIDNDIKTRNIIIKTTGGETPRLEIQDSAGGIPESVIDNVFQAHFTTKEEGKGTGIGLYMSSQIAQKHHAKLSVENREKGACFIVEFSELSFRAEG